MNKEKLAKLEAGVRIGGPGSARRKRKIIRKSSTTDDKKLQNSLKKLSVNNISGIEEVNMIKEDGTVIHFNNPKVQASLNANTFAISGHSEAKQITEMLPHILSHMGQEGFSQLKKVPEDGNVKLDDMDLVRAAAAAAARVDDEDDAIPVLVDDFETASKKDPVSSNEKKGASDNKENKPEQSKKSKKKKKKANAAKATEELGKTKDGGEADDEGEDGK